MNFLKQKQNFPYFMLLFFFLGVVLIHDTANGFPDHLESDTGEVEEPSGPIIDPEYEEIRGTILHPDFDFDFESSENNWITRWGLSVSTQNYKELFHFDINFDELGILMHQTDEPQPITIFVGFIYDDDDREYPQYATFTPEAFSVRETPQGLTRVVRGTFVYNEKSGYFNLWSRNGFISGEGRAGGIPPWDDESPPKFISFKLAGSPTHFNMVWF